MKSTTRIRKKIDRLRDQAATLLDKTHEYDNRGPKTYQARQEVAQWLDVNAGRIPIKSIIHLQSVINNIQVNQ